MLLLALLVLAPPSAADPMAYLHEDAYDFTPARHAEWEAAQFTHSGVFIDMGSVNYREFWAVQRLNLQLPLSDRLELHGEVRNDRDRDASVTRVVADLMFRAGENLAFGVSGSPAARKQDYALGASALLSTRDRLSYLLLRLVADQFIYNRTNTDGGQRGLAPLHPQIEARVEQGALSAWAMLDSRGAAETVLQDGTYSSGARTDLWTHLRYAARDFEADARFDLTVLRDSADAPDGAHGRHMTLSTARLDALLAEWHGVRPRFGLRFTHVAGNGEDAGTAWALSRFEPGVLAALQLRAGMSMFELGYDTALPDLDFRGDGAAAFTRYQDKLYGSWEVSFTEHLHARTQLSLEPANRLFGGGNATFLALF